MSQISNALTAALTEQSDSGANKTYKLCKICGLVGTWMTEERGIEGHYVAGVGRRATW